MYVHTQMRTKERKFVLWKKCLFLQNAKNMIDAPEEAQSTH